MPVVDFLSLIFVVVYYYYVIVVILLKYRNLIDCWLSLEYSRKKTWRDTYKYLDLFACTSLRNIGFVPIVVLREEFEDTKGVIIIRISTKNREHDGQKKKYKRTNNDLQYIHIKLKIK